MDTVKQFNLYAKGKCWTLRGPGMYRVHFEIDLLTRKVEITHIVVLWGKCKRKGVVIPDDVKAISVS